MKRSLTLIILSLLLFAGCEQEETLRTEIKVKLESVGGSRARFSVTPANPHAYYTYILVSSKEDNYNIPEFEVCLEEIQNMEEAMSHLQGANFMDAFCYQGSRQINLSAIYDDTDFKLIVFQIHPETHEILGNPVITEFRTKPVPERELYFEVNFEGELLTITPSDNNLTYFWQFKESDQIYDDYGTATYYLYSVAGMYQEYGFMDMLYSQGSVEWDFAMENNMHDGTEYLLIISGCEEGELTTPTTIAKFRYHPGHIEILEIFEENDW